jgi:hypothetical protein
METLKKQVRRAQRRLILQQLLRNLTWCLSAALLAAAVLVAVGKYWPMGVEDWHWVAGSAAAGVLGALVWTLITRHGALEAAIEIDRRFGLKERVSSTLALPPSEVESPAGRALAADALKRVEQIHVADRFGLQLSRWSWLPLVPAALVFLVAVFVQPPANTNEAQATQDILAQKKAIKESTAALQKRLLERRKIAREQGLKDAEDLFEKLERGTKELAKTDVDRKQALVNLNDLAKELEKRREQLGDNQKLKEQFNQLKDLKQGPADKLAQAMKDGDLNQAMKELEALKQQLKAGELDEKAQQKLGEQLADIEKKLREMAEEHERKMADLKQRMEQKRQAGQNDEADELERQLQRMQAQKPQMQQMKDLADKLGKCAECMKQGDAQQAQQALNDLKADLNELQAQLEEMKMLDEALDEIAECKACMGGMGSKKDGRPGFGLGEGRGQGDRPEERTDVKFHDSNVKQKTGKGAAIVTGFTDGPNKRGEVQQEIQLQFESAKSDDADPLTGERLPRDYRDHAKGYFDAFREGEKK